MKTDRPQQAGCFQSPIVGDADVGPGQAFVFGEFQLLALHVELRVGELLFGGVEDVVALGDPDRQPGLAEPGAPAADLNGAVGVILAVASMVENDPSSIVELDINPLMLLSKGQGVVAADALIKMY